MLANSDGWTASNSGKRRRRKIISQSLSAGITHTGKHIKFEVSDDSDEEEEQVFIFQLN